DCLIALARAARAEWLVSGDRHLLELADPDAPVLTPRGEARGLLRGGVRGHDLAQDLFEHRVALLADQFGPAASDSVARFLGGLARPPPAVGGDDAFGAAILRVGL